MTRPAHKQRLSLNRNIHTGNYLDIFLVAAVSSLLLLRFILYLAGYPQVGGGTLHIAHMLWGGLLMLGAIIISLSFIGRRIQQLTALMGGVGFGIFIDELGKFITKDNNYFFKPTIGIIYAIFIGLYLLFRFLGQQSSYTSREYQLNALLGLEEAVALDLDRYEKTAIQQLLARADKDSDITKLLQQLLHEVSTVRSDKPSIFKRISLKIDAIYMRFWSARRSNNTVQVIAMVLVALFLFGIVLTVYANTDAVIDILKGNNSYSHLLLVGQIASASIAAVFSLIGIIRLSDSHLDAFANFRRAALVNIFLTEFFLFIREQFGAMPSFTANLLLLLLFNFVIRQERRLSTHHTVIRKAVSNN
jgi:hypothetical protein